MYRYGFFRSEVQSAVERRSRRQGLQRFMGRHMCLGMVPVALGTQTKGSVLRPASFCGVTGFKPSYGLLPMEGVLPLAKSLDTLGLFTQTPADMLALWKSMGHPTGRTEDFALGVPDPMPCRCKTCSSADKPE